MDNDTNVLIHTATDGTVTVTKDNVGDYLIPIPMGSFYHQPTLTSTDSTLTIEEIKELDRLREEYNSKIKSLKLEKFKSLSPELRQFVINLFLWHHAVSDINNTHVEKSDMHKKLENTKNSQFDFWQAYEDNTSLAHAIPIPENLSVEDLIEAHKDATVENEVLKHEQ